MTERGTPCIVCGKPINSRAWLKCYPYADECGKDCFLTAALSEPLYASDGRMLHPGHPAAIRERQRLDPAWAR